MRADDVQREARKLVGTKFHHGGRRAGVGVDCAGVLVVIARAIKYRISDATIAYSRVPDGESLVRLLRANLDEIPIAEMRPADVGVFWFDHVNRTPQHVGVFVERRDGIGLVHAFQEVDRVVEHLFRPIGKPAPACDGWQERLCHVFRWRGLTWPR